MRNYWKSKESDILFEGILKLRNTKECERFFRDAMTMRELKEVISRFKIARELDRKDRKSYIEIAQEVGTSTATVTRVAQWLKGGAAGYRLVLDRLNK